MSNMNIEMTWENGGLLKRMSGALSEEEFLLSSEQVLADPRFKDIRFVINDLLQVTGNDFSRGMLPYLAAIQYGSKATHSRCRVIFVSRDETILALIKDTLVTRDLDHFEVATASSVEAAKDWIKKQPVLN
jgi:hypothetical protein